MHGASNPSLLPSLIPTSVPQVHRFEQSTFTIWAHALGLVIAALLAGLTAGCGTQLTAAEPEAEAAPPTFPELLTLSSPLSGFHYTAIDDVAPDQPGLQIDVRVRVQDLVRGFSLDEIHLTVGDQPSVAVPVRESFDGRVARLPAVTVAVGPAAAAVRVRAFLDEELALELTEAELLEPDQPSMVQSLITASWEAPSLETCGDRVVVTGDLIVDNDTELAFADGCLTVGGDLVVEGTGLESLQGLNGLVEVGGNVTVSHNDALSSLHGLEGLRRVGGDLTVVQNGALAPVAIDDLLSRLVPDGVGGAVVTD